ncbi:uncharacterized protein LOC105173277 [Sesamum indicum]|uniref:Uncharacterized protein LOC105173277 n=1 Tax=Sesamum indicum TaxID=4182 RepID=A0A6I9U2X2_SESIN|nr:uncharacterized protein LOC105173277 [Sesamum indicum]
MEPSTYKSNGMFAIELEEELMKFTTTYEINKGDGDLVEQIAEVHRDTDVEVDITECTKSGGVDLVEAECLDTTESSSSFDDCDYGVENVDTLADSEALSDFHGDAASALDFDGFSEMFRMRKKKRTTHWRSFIQPLMWRCKWVELQIKKFEAQAQEYDRKLDEYSQRKQTQLEKHPLKGLGVKSLPHYQNDATTEVLRRKKRTRAEATKDVTAYMSNHNLFSYYENRKHFTEGAFMDSELKNPAKGTQKVNTSDEFLGDDEMLCVENGSDDDSLEHIFQKIELLQSQVGNLKSRVDKVIISGKAETFPLTENWSLPFLDNALVDSPPNTATPPNDVDRMPVGTYIAAQLISEFNMGDLLVPESILTSHGEVFPDANGSINHISLADACGNGDDEVLIDNWRVNEEMNSFEEVKIQPTQRPLVLKDASGSTSPPVPAEGDLPMDDQPPPKTRSISKLLGPASKTKRGRQNSVGR